MNTIRAPWLKLLFITITSLASAFAFFYVDVKDVNAQWCDGRGCGQSSPCSNGNSVPDPGYNPPRSSSSWWENNSTSNSSSNDGGGGQWCGSGTTQTSEGTCCPNNYVKTTTTGSGKGQTVLTCDAPKPTPPTASISQSKITTEVGESFTVSYGREGGGSAFSCVLERTLSSSAYENDGYVGGKFFTAGIMRLLSFVSKNSTEKALASGDGVGGIILSANQVASNSGSRSNFIDNLSTTGTYTYRAQCHGAGGSSPWVSLEHDVVIPAPTVSLSADKYIVPYNTGTILRWTSQNATSCTASGVWGGSKAINGNEPTANLTDPSSYFLQCRDDNNQTTNPVVVNINILYGEGAKIEVNPAVTYKNSPVTVTWDTGTSDPANCQIQTGSVILQSPLTNSTGSLTHTIAGETVFTLNCENNRNNAEATVKILPSFQET